MNTIEKIIIFNYNNWLDVILKSVYNLIYTRFFFKIASKTFHLMPFGHIFIYGYEPFTHSTIYFLQK